MAHKYDSDNVIIGLKAPTGSATATVWILAALSLPYGERIEAMDDIADMLGTSYGMVQSAATKLKAKQHAEAGLKSYSERGNIYQAAPFRPNRKMPEGASSLRQPSREDLMAGRARTRPRA